MYKLRITRSDGTLRYEVNQSDAESARRVGDQKSFSGRLDWNKDEHGVWYATDFTNDQFHTVSEVK